MDPGQVREYVVRPTLLNLGLWSAPAEELVMGTAAQESHFHWIDQRDNAGRPGPAYGLWQMEEATHDDLWANFIKPELADKIRAVCALPSIPHRPPVATLHFNLRYGAAMCRVHYLRKPGAIPGGLEGQAAYWKQWYNTLKGAGTVEQYIANYRKFCT